MNCPSCATALQMSERLGVEIDYCPKCRGVWLDRGELDKVLDRNREVPADLYDREEMYERDDPRSPHHGPPRPEHPPYRKKKSFLNELFDFG